MAVILCPRTSFLLPWYQT